MLICSFLLLPVLAGCAAQSQRPAPRANQEAAEENVIPDSFVALKDVVPDALQDVRYASSFNFVGTPVRGYEEPCVLLTREAAIALKGVSDDVQKDGYRLKVYDGYRPTTAVRHFVEWAKDLSDTRMKPYFYPEKQKKNLFAEGYIAEKSGHSRGSTLDLTLFDMKTGKDVDMGGTFDYFGERSHAYQTKNLTKTQQQNRKYLRDAMMRHGFKPVREEWWHFTLKNEPYPKTYFSFPVRNPARKGAFRAPAERPSPVWVTRLPAAKKAQQLFIVGVYANQSAWISLHEKKNGVWTETVSTPGFIGREGLGKTREGDGKTPVGTYHVTKAFGILPDPGCSIPYTMVNDNHYWSGDERPGKRYNEFVDIRDIPDLDTKNSEHIIEYTDPYQYCLNVSYNEKGKPGLGSAIFIHCFGARKPYTGGCIALPREKMRSLMQKIDKNCVVLIDSLQALGGNLND